MRARDNYSAATISLCWRYIFLPYFLQLFCFMYFE